jgi:hypothetical protein
MTDPLPSWNDCPAKHAIIASVKDSVIQNGPHYIKPEDRIAAFEQDGTLWVEQPAYLQLMFTFHLLSMMAAKDPKLEDVEPFKTVLSGDSSAIAQLPMSEVLKVVALAHSSITREVFQKTAHDWITTAKHPRFKRLYTDLVYQPMLEVMQYLRANDYKTFIIAGHGEQFVRTFAERVYGIPHDQVVGSAKDIRFSHGVEEKPILAKDPKLLWTDDRAAKPAGIQATIKHRPVIAFGNAEGDPGIFGHPEAERTCLTMLIHHDDPTREYAYAEEPFTDPLAAAPDAPAKHCSPVIISIKNDWKRIFAWH